MESRIDLSAKLSREGTADPTNRLNADAPGLGCHANP